MSYDDRVKMRSSSLKHPINILRLDKSRKEVDAEAAAAYHECNWQRLNLMAEDAAEIGGPKGPPYYFIDVEKGDRKGPPSDFMGAAASI
jgi:hypothetical protein